MLTTLRTVGWTCILLAGAVTAAAQTPAAPPVPKIPLETIYSTSGQPELKRVESGPALEVAKPPAVAAFAWAKDFKGLTQDTLIAPTATPDKPQTLTRPADRDVLLWAVVNLGSGGSLLPQFVVNSALWPKDRQLVVTFDRTPLGPATRDLRPYILWIPLGKVTAGDYVLQLVTGGKVEGAQKWTVVDPTANGTTDTLNTGISTTQISSDNDQISVNVRVPDDQPNTKPTAGGGRGRR